MQRAVPIGELALGLNRLALPLLVRADSKINGAGHNRFGSLGFVVPHHMTHSSDARKQVRIWQGRDGSGAASK